MNDSNRNVIVAIVAAIVLVLLVCCCAVAASIALTGGCATLGLGGVMALVNMPAPYGIDERPAVPAGVDLEDLWPRDVPGYRIVQTYAVDSFAGAALPRGGVSFVYDGPGGRVQTVAAQTASESQARRFVSGLSEQVKKGRVSSHLTRTLPGRSAFFQWHVSSLEEFAYGIVWTNGPWVFGVASSSQAARDAVADAFPY